MYKIITAVEAFSWPHKTDSVKAKMKFINKTMREIRKAAKAGDTMAIVEVNSLDLVDVGMAAAFLSNLGYKVIIQERWVDHHFTYRFKICWGDEEFLKYVRNDAKIASELAQNSVMLRC